MEIDTIKKQFGNEAANYTKFRKPYPQELYDLLFSRFPQDGKKILDIACGTGKSTEPLLLSGLEVFGCDHDELMIEEAQKLHENTPSGAANLSWKRMEELGLEYRSLALFLQEKMTREEMIERLGFEIWHYAKRQLAWFKRNKRIQWFENGTDEEITKSVSRFLQ